MEYLQVKNWRTFQHYSMRNPPWIRVYNSLLENHVFAALPDVTKAHLVEIWLFASRSENCIPNDPAFVATRINANTPVDLDLLVSVGFLEAWVDASEVLAPSENRASNMLARSENHASNMLAPLKQGSQPCLLRTEQNRIEKNRTEQSTAEKSACSASENLPPITKQEEEESAKRIFEQLREDPEGTRLAAALLARRI